ncbi:proton channel OTOP3 [Rhinatrema bivittatum]|uniref:proton channel OTOP3 n=1 Tax=Rhinatrema bivittatum TaxID=194408 RepID=UPI001129BFB9|nr:proton channel OTOP3 [Rhinatrema bivittatum]
MADEEARRGRRPSQASEGSTSADAPRVHYEKSWLSRKCSSHIMRDRQAQKSGQLFSGLLAMNVVFLGTALISSNIFNKQAITSWDVKIFLSILMVLSICWTLYYQLVTSRKPHAVLYKDSHAGAFWLRGSLILFGACSILLAVFKIGYEATSLDSLHPVEILFPVLEILFISSQTSLLWFFCKDCTQVQHTITRYGLTLTLATDLLLWVLVVSNDSVQREMESTSHPSENLTLSDTNSSGCGSSDLAICHSFRKGYVTLYPFYLEYCLICCSMLYIMWKNVGRRISHHGTHATPKFKLHGVIFGPMLGSCTLLIGISIFSMYQIQATTSVLTKQSFILYYSYCVTLLPVMALCSVSGTIIHSLEERELDTRKNPTRSLDVVLLLGASLGPFAISYYSIVASVATDPTGLLSSLNLSYSVIIIVEHIVQNIFVIEGLRRTPPAQCGRMAPSRPHKMNSLPTQNEEGAMAPIGQNHTESDGHKVIEAEGKTCEEKVGPYPRRASLLNSRRESLQHFRRASHVYLQNYSQLNWKRRALKEIAIFLILCNIILWIMPAFGAQPQFENGLEKAFYGRSTWFTILNFGLPLGVFYRMHSVGGLLEIYLTA